MKIGSSLKAGGLFKSSEDDITPSAIFKKWGTQTDEDVTPTAMFQGSNSQFGEEITPTLVFNGETSQASGDNAMGFGTFG